MMTNQQQQKKKNGIMGWWCLVFSIHPSFKHASSMSSYTTLTNFSTKYLVMCKVYTEIGGIK